MPSVKRMKIENHRLSDSDALNHEYSTPNLGSTFAEGRPDTLVMHFTAGGSAASSAQYLCQPKAKASAHIVIGREGTVYQLADFNRITWHAGRSRWQGRKGLNRYSIGIELDNAGQLTQAADGHFETWFGRRVADNEVHRGQHRNRTQVDYWHSYTESQLEVTFELCALLIEHYGIATLVGHEEIAPDRKTDPGPAFPLERMRQRLLGESRELEEDLDSAALRGAALVNASKLNIRSGPGSAFDKVAEPLRMGEAVEILAQEGDWVQVEKKTTGWVNRRYLLNAEA